MEIANNRHLGYCTNIHPGETWCETLANIENHVVAVKEKFCPQKPFGIGLRLSYRACQELIERGVSELQDICAKNNMYVFTINGFIYGHFHKKPVKKGVYLPDWSSKERITFSNTLAQILSKVLPKDITGTISTVPVGFKDRFLSRDLVAEAANHLIEHVIELYNIKKQTGKKIITCLEPEPGCYIETIAETIDFFRTFIFNEDNYKKFSERTKETREQSEVFIKNHLGICYDTCHMAIEYENAKHGLSLLQENEIVIGKVQISSAIKIEFQAHDKSIVEYLQPFVDVIYLHQVVENRDGKLTRFSDLPEAMEHLSKYKDSHLIEWRIHFHIPIFMDNMELPIRSTQEHITETLSYLKKQNICEHFEVETYTWDVLPQEYTQISLHDSITRELQWALEQIRS